MGDSDSIVSNVEWLNEKIPYLDHANWLYKIICFLMGRIKHKLTYWEMYLILYGTNRGKRFSEEDAKRLSMLRTIEIYKFHHNNKLPNGVKYDD